MSDLLEILSAICAGESPDVRLLPRVYDELRQLAASRLARERGDQTLQPTALVHEAWMRMGGSQQPAWENAGHFFAAAAQAMRRILVDRARHRDRQRRGGGRLRVDFDAIDVAATLPPDDDQLLALDVALAKLQAASPEKAQIVQLKFFAGMSNREVASALQVTERTVERQWAYAKAWLANKMQGDDAAAENS